MRYILLLCFLVAATANADVNVPKGSVQEDFSPDIKVASRNYFLGLQLATEGRAGDLYLRFPPAPFPSSSFLCIELASIDGKYRGSIAYKLEQNVDGLERITFPSEHADKLKSYQSREIAVLASLRESCDSGPSDSYLLASWGNDLSGQLIVLIRSNSRVDTLHYLSDKVRCKKFRADVYPVTYDKYCVVDIDTSKPGEIEIQRKNLQSVPPETIRFD